MAPLDANNVRTDDQRVGDILEHAALATKYARTLGNISTAHIARGDVQKHVTKGAMLQCLVIIGVAASGLSKECRARYPGLVWKRVIGLRKLNGKPDRLIDFDYVQRELTEIVPTLLKELR